MSVAGFSPGSVRAPGFCGFGMLRSERELDCAEEYHRKVFYEPRNFCLIAPYNQKLTHHRNPTIDLRNEKEGHSNASASFLHNFGAISLEYGLQYVTIYNVVAA
jgi:hypothetical protein